jgi:phytoene dehydrogenase-like protein
VGGGPAGLVAAIAARHAGYDVKVFEQAPSFARIGGAIGIQSNGLRVLDALGVLPRFPPHIELVGQAAVEAWLAAHPRVHFPFTPKGASWLNMVEAWFSVLTRKSVRRGSFDTVRALIRHLTRYIEEWNAHPTPFCLDQTARPTSSRRPSAGVLNMTSRTEH